MKPTKNSSFIPMTPNSRPGQRLNQVVSLPEKPVDLDVSLVWENPIQGKHFPKGTPRKLTFICSVEWAWSPMNNRIANYYINPKPWGWALWDNVLDDHSVPWSWWWDFVAYTGKTNADEKTIATFMLLESWKGEAAHQMLDHYHWINDTGCLDVEDIQAIARQVWES